MFRLLILLSQLIRIFIRKLPMLLCLFLPVYIGITGTLFIAYDKSVLDYFFTPSILLPAYNSMLDYWQEYHEFLPVSYGIMLFLPPILGVLAGIILWFLFHLLKRKPRKVLSATAPVFSTVRSTSHAPVIIEGEYKVIPGNKGL